MERTDSLINDLRKALPRDEARANFQIKNSKAIGAIVYILEELRREKSKCEYQISYDEMRGMDLILEVETPHLLLRQGVSMKNLFAEVGYVDIATTEKGTLKIKFVFGNAVKYR